MITKFKNLLFLFFNYSFNFLYQKIKYRKSFLYTISENEISKHETNFYENQIKQRKKIKLNNTVNIQLDKLVFDNSINLSDPINPLVLTAKEIIKNANIKLEDTSIYKFYTLFNPQNFKEVFFISSKDSFFRLNKLGQFELFYPWHHKYPQRFLVPGMFGPKNILVPKLRFIRLKNLVYLIKKYEYNPNNHDHICGYKLSHQSDYRFVITAGTHRSSVIKALNFKYNDKSEIDVKYDSFRIKNGLFEVKLDNINLWPGVRSGYFSKDEAEKMFFSFFKYKKFIYK